jgi:hypothetical protein
MYCIYVPSWGIDLSGFVSAILSSSLRMVVVQLITNDLVYFIKLITDMCFTHRFLYSARSIYRHWRSEQLYQRQTAAHCKPPRIAGIAARRVWPGEA